jgi:hypothetical protein
MTRKLKESVKKIIASSQGWKCKICNELLNSSYQIDHIIPHCISLDDTQSNLQALCANCHCKKSQRETVRIIRYKKLCSILNKNVCWFCLKSYMEIGECCNGKTLSDIVFPQKLVKHTVHELDKFMYTEEKPVEDITKSLSKININRNDILKIKLTQTHIWINDTYCYPCGEYYLSDIAKAVFNATRTKRDSNWYREVEIIMSFDETSPDEMIDYIDENLHKELPERIFNKEKQIEYTYIHLI